MPLLFSTTNRKKRSQDHSIHFPSLVFLLGKKKKQSTVTGTHNYCVCMICPFSTVNLQVVVGLLRFFFDNILLFFVCILIWSIPRKWIHDVWLIACGCLLVFYSSSFSIYRFYGISCVLLTSFVYCVDFHWLSNGLGLFRCLSFKKICSSISIFRSKFCSYCLLFRYFV